MIELRDVVVAYDTRVILDSVNLPLQMEKRLSF